MGWASSVAAARVLTSRASISCGREIDLQAGSRRFVPRLDRLCGAAIGLLVGVVYSFGGGSTYTATALIARGQAFSPNGNNTVPPYLSIPAAIQAFATS
jgi:hypothetical protein